MREFELKTDTGQVVRWQGETGEGAARRYVDCFRDARVVAWREFFDGFQAGVDPRNIIG